MRPDPDTVRRAAARARLAAPRHGIVTRAQLLALSYSNAAIDRLVRAGRLHRLYPGVFAVGHTVLTHKGRLLAAVLAGGPGAVLSHASAGGLWEVQIDSGGRIHITVPAGSGRRPTPGIAVHRTRRVIESTIVDGIPVTTPMRTLADLADTLPDRQLEKAVEQAHALRLLDVAAIDRIAVAHGAGPRGPRRLQRLVRTHDRHHSSRARFEHDRAKDAHLIAHGWRVVRLTHARVTNEPDSVARLLHQLLATTPRQLPPRARAAG